MKKYSNKTVIESLGLPMLTCFDDLVKELSLSRKLVYWLTKEDAKGRYKTFFIEKRNGNKRKINAPSLSLKIVQRWVLKNILYKIKVSQYSYGFTKEKCKGSPLVYCAEKHKNNLYVFKLDLKNFYPSINRKKVYYVFSNIGYNSDVSNLLTNICTVDGELPQGAVTSSYLANLICRKLDLRIAGYCNKRNIVYTRYADDITISTQSIKLPKIIGAISDDGLLCLSKKITDIINNQGFTINSNKLNISSINNRQEVTGLIVNNKT